MSGWEYRRAGSPEQAGELLAGERSARPMGGGTDLLPQLERGINVPELVVDLRPLGLDRIEHGAGGTRIGALTPLADVARDETLAERYAALHLAASAAASPQLREMGTVGGNLCQQPRCWFFRHPDLHCWLQGGETCYAQLGDHRKHGLEPGDCISVAPSDLAAALLALGAAVETNRRASFPLEQLYARPSGAQRRIVQLDPGEFVTAVELPAAPDASAYARAGERAAWSFALVGVAAARRGDEVRLAAIGVANIPLLLDPADPLAGLPGMPMTGWKRKLLSGLVTEATTLVGSL